MITPKGNEDFEINLGAANVHGWTKERLLSLPNSERPTIKDAWIAFFSWAKEVTLLKDKPIVLCAYNGFLFDYRLLIHNLSYFGYVIKDTILLIDPWLDIYKLEQKCFSLDELNK